MKDWVDSITNAVGLFMMAILSLIIVVIIIGGIGFGLSWLFSSSESREQSRQAEIKRATPSLYAQVDGCDVYRWYADGHHHYFTKCQSKVVTEVNHSEYCGKACTRTVTEKIETERK